MTDAIAPVEATDNAAPEAAPETPAVVPESGTPADSSNWRTSLPDDIRESASLEKFETIEGLAKSYINAEKMIGADKIVIPKEGDDDGWNEVWSKLGRPDEASGYEFKEPESVPEGLKYSEEVDGRLASILHKNGVPKSMAGTLREDLISLVSEGGLISIEQTKAAEAEHEKVLEKGREALKRDWGDAYDQRRKIAYKAAESNLSEETIASMNEAGLFDNPSIVKDMYEMGLKVQGEKQLLGDIDLEQSPGDLDQMIAKFNSDNIGALMDKSHPKHDWAVQEQTKLFGKRYG